MSSAIKSNTIIDGKYKIIKLIGEGGMSYVYQAKDINKNTDVALKFLKKNLTSSYVEDSIRFKREMKAISKLNHPNIIKIISAGDHENTPFIVMELIKGQNLSNYIKTNKNISINNSVKIVKTLSDILSYVHSENLLHRDIKPANIMLINDKNKIKIKLLDFGIALIMELKNITEEHHIAGTFGYMSPEATGIIKKKVDERSDLYSVGVVFYKLLTKENPFSAKKLSVLLHQQVTSNPKTPIKLNKNVPKIISNITMKLLAKEQELRYQSAKGLSHDLQKFLSGEYDFIIGEKDQKVKLTYQTTLIGRNKELNTIKDSINNALNNSGNVCLINGDPGAGKTRLIEATKEYIYEQGYEQSGLFLEGHCISQINKIPYQPFKDILNQYIRKFEKLSPTDQKKERARIKEIVGDLGKILIILNPNMKTILNEVPNLVTLDPERENQRFLMVISKFFLQLVNKGIACVLCIDDLQWADEGTLRLIKEIMNKIRNSNLMIIGTYRVNEVNEQHSLTKIIADANKNNYPLTQISINTFDFTHMNEIVSGILGQTKDKSIKLSKYILNKSGGNPFFAITIIREIVEQQTIKWKEGYWEENWKKINNIHIPNNIVDMILRRLENLPEETDRILRICATIGKEFEINMLHRLANVKKEIIIEIIDDAIERQLIEKSSTHKGNANFVHDKIKEVFYGKMKKKEKINFHIRIAEEIEKEKKRHTPDILFSLAYHYIEGKDNDKALKYAIPAAEKAKENYANEEAIHYYTKSIDMLKKCNKIGSDEWIKTNDGLIDVYLTIGHSQGVIQLSDELLPYKKTAQEKMKTFKKIGLAYFKKGDWKNCEKKLNQGLKHNKEFLPQNIVNLVFSITKELVTYFLLTIFFNKKIIPRKKNIKNGDKETVQIYEVANWMYVLSDVNKFIYSTLRGLNFALMRVGKSQELGAAFSYIASLFMAIPLFKQAKIYHNKGLSLVKKLKNKPITGQAYQLLGFSYQWEGNYKKSHYNLEESRSINQSIGDMWELGMTYQGIGHNYYFKSDYKNAIHAFGKFLEISLSINDNYGISASRGWLSLVYSEMGEFKKSKQEGLEAYNISSSDSISFIECFSLMNLGYLSMETNDLEKAIDYLEKSLKLYKQNTFLKNYTLHLFPFIAELYLKLYCQKTNPKIKLSTVRKKYKTALNQTRFWPNYYANALRNKAKYFGLRKKTKIAKKTFEKSISLLKKLNRRYELAKSYCEYGNFFDQIDKKENAKEQWNKAYNIFKEIGAQEYIKHTKKLLNITDEKEIAKDDISPQERLRLDRRMNTVLDTSRHLSSILDINELLEKIMDKTVELVGAERGILYLNINNKLKPKILRNIKQGESDLITINDIVITQVQKENKPLIFEDASSIKKSLSSDSTRSSTNISLKSILCAPIITKNELLGVLYLDNHRVTGLFKEEDLKVLELISSQAGVSIENARLYNNLKEQERLKKEMEIAKRIQTAIVPEAPLHDELYITAVMQPAEEVGGDYYDIMYDKNKNLWFAIGDVSGHGVTPGLVMMMAQSSFAATISDNGNLTPKEAIVNVNKILYENIKTRLKEDHFMTMDFIKYLGKGNFIHAGSHLDIIIYRDKTKTCELVATKGVYLGLIPDASRSLFDNTFSLNKNDLMLLYTDGVTEARNKDNRNDLWGEDKLQNMLIKHSSNEVEAIKDAIVKKVLDWCGNKPDDDITMVLIKMK